MINAKRTSLILLTSSLIFYVGCVSVEEFDFENYEASKAKSFIFKQPIIDKPKENKVVPPPRIVEKAKEKREQRVVAQVEKPVEIPKVTMKEAVERAEIEEKKLEEMKIKLYTPELYIDRAHYSEGQKKGAVQLVWSKKGEELHYQVEIFQQSTPHSRRTFATPYHFLHIMVFFEKDYLWRVRRVNEEGKPLTEYSYLKPLKVISQSSAQRALSSEK